MKQEKHQHQAKLRLLLPILLLVLVAIGVGLFFYHHNHTSSQKLREQGYTSSTTKSGSKATTVPGSSTSQGGAIDKNGQAGSSATSPSTATVSSSGAITVTRPAKNGAIASGDTITGTAIVNAVQFRVIDNLSGVAAQGSLDVVNGSFAGVLNFRHQSSAGRLDVYSYDTNGVEINEVQIPISLK